MEVASTNHQVSDAGMRGRKVGRQHGSVGIQQDRNPVETEGAVLNLKDGSSWEKLQGSQAHAATMRTRVFVKRRRRRFSTIRLTRVDWNADGDIQIKRLQRDDNGL